MRFLPIIFLILAACLQEEQTQNISDLDFFIDCSELEQSKLPSCESYINKTRDLSYPVLRELTMTNLSGCYPAVYYKIKKNDFDPAAGGSSALNNITFSAAYSVDSQPYDVHELLHSISQCNDALDNHVFHGGMLTAVYARIGKPGLAPYGSVAEVDEELQRLNLYAPDPEICSARLGGLVTRTYFIKGESALTKLYRSTIPEENYGEKAKILRSGLESELGKDYVNAMLPGCS
jgi:hypothetical protein